jgi:acyl-CoA thioesterase
MSSGVPLYPSPQVVAAAMWAEDRASQNAGLVIGDIGAGYAVLTMFVREGHLNGLGVCHGGYIFLLADSAMAFASNSHNHMALAAAASIDFVRPARLGDELIATAREELVGPRVGLTSVDVRCRDGSLIASFHGRTSRNGAQVVSHDPAALDD